MRALLAAGDPTAWADEEERLADELRDLGGQRDAAVEARRDAHNELAALERSADVPG